MAKKDGKGHRGHGDGNTGCDGMCRNVNRRWDGRVDGVGDVVLHDGNRGTNRTAFRDGDGDGTAGGAHGKRKGR